MMNRRFFAPLLTLIVVTGLSVGIATAQPPGGGFGGGFGGGRGGRMGGMMGGMMSGMMLRMPEVQKELKLTDDQKTALQAKQQEMGEKMREMFQGGPDQDPEERQKKMKEFADEQKKAIDSVLNADQQKRFHELELQQMFQMAPGQALSREDVATKIKLTEAQKKQLEAITTKAGEDRRALMQGQDFQSMTQDERQAMMAKQQAIQKESAEKIQAVLTDDQKKAWKEMVGEPFKFPAMGRGGFGGGRRQGGGGPGAGV